MANWWVNHKLTYREETEGGYLWSPKRNKNGARNQTYDNMGLVAPGDLIFSYADQLIRQVGIAADKAMPSPKPADFGNKGEYWNTEGWLVPVQWQPLANPISPKSIISELAPHLPDKYSPISADGNGRQNVYLASISEKLAAVLLAKVPEAGEIIEASGHPDVENPLIVAAEDSVETAIQNDTTMTSTEREDIIKARRGQGKFRRNLESIEDGCRITGVTDRRLLRASHIKPWRLCETNHERLDGNNGLLLTPTFDLLFDQGYISFRDGGSCIISAKLPEAQLVLIGLSATNVLAPKLFNEQQRLYLKFHRELFSFD